MPEEKICIWMRVGAYVEVSREEAEKVFDGDLSPVINRLNTGEYAIGGETYIPEFVIEEYNTEHKTDFCTRDLDFYM